MTQSAAKTCTAIAVDEYPASRFQIHLFRSSHTLIACVSPTYASSVSIRIGQYSPGKCASPSEDASGEYGSDIPKAMMDNVVAVSGQLARLCRNGILFVRITWMINVCVISDSTNQPVWNTFARAGSQQWKTQSMTKNVV